MTRCKRCWLLEADCLCDKIHSVKTRTRVRIILHSLEARRSTNTGRIAHLLLENSSVDFHGRQDAPITNSFALTPGYLPLLLYPDGAHEVHTVAEKSELPIELIVPDGNWNQAARIGRRINALKDVEHVRLPAMQPIHVLRRGGPERLGTCEAIFRTIGLLEGQDIETELLEQLELFARSMLGERGRRTGREPSKRRSLPTTD
ncbi:MAG: DTW domain-containing protein [Leptospirales bacterium]|nr:DTW domain-containing protein [Leptospirales bacterium]